MEQNKQIKAKQAAEDRIEAAKEMRAFQKEHKETESASGSSSASASASSSSSASDRPKRNAAPTNSMEDLDTQKIDAMLSDDDEQVNARQFAKARGAGAMKRKFEATIAEKDEELKAQEKQIKRLNRKVEQLEAIVVASGAEVPATQATQATQMEEDEEEVEEEVEQPEFTGAGKGKEAEQ